MSDEKPGALIPEIPPGGPAFLNSDAVAQAKYPGADDAPTFDHELPPDEYEGLSEPPAGKGPSRGYQERHRAIARLIALGHRPRAIARRLGYSDTGISLALKSPFIQKEIERYRSQLFDGDVLTALKDLGPDAVNVITQMINSDDQKLKDRTEAAKWLLEKLTGKPKQEVNLESQTLGAFMDLVKNMQQRGESLDVVDVTHSALPEAREAGAPQAPEPPKDELSDIKTWINAELR